MFSIGTPVHELTGNSIFSKFGRKARKELKNTYCSRNRIVVCHLHRSKDHTPTLTFTHPTITNPRAILLPFPFTVSTYSMLPPFSSLTYLNVIPHDFIMNRNLFKIFILKYTTCFRYNNLFHVNVLDTILRPIRNNAI